MAGDLLDEAFDEEDSLDDPNARENTEMASDFIHDVVSGGGDFRRALHRLTDEPIDAGHINQGNLIALTDGMMETAKTSLKRQRLKKVENIDATTPPSSPKNGSRRGSSKYSGQSDCELVIAFVKEVIV